MTIVFNELGPGEQSVFLVNLKRARLRERRVSPEVTRLVTPRHTVSGRETEWAKVDVVTPYKAASVVSQRELLGDDIYVPSAKFDTTTKTCQTVLIVCLDGDSKDRPGRHQAAILGPHDRQSGRNVDFGRDLEEWTPTVYDPRFRGSQDNAIASTSLDCHTSQHGTIPLHFKRKLPALTTLGL